MLLTARVCYTRNTPFSITGTHVGVAAPTCKVHACVTLPLVGTVHANKGLNLLLNDNTEAAEANKSWGLLKTNKVATTVTYIKIFCKYAYYF